MQNKNPGFRLGKNNHGTHFTGPVDILFTLKFSVSGGFDVSLTTFAVGGCSGWVKNRLFCYMTLKQRKFGRRGRHRSRHIHLDTFKNWYFIGIAWLTRSKNVKSTCLFNDTPSYAFTTQFKMEERTVELSSILVT